MKPKPPAIYLSERQLAARLAVGTSTVQRWRQAGRLPHFKLGDVIRYRLTDVETFEANYFTDAVVAGFKPAATRRPA